MTRSARRLLLRQLLTVHDRGSHALALPDSLGDAVLVRDNAVFRNVRACMLALGYRLSATPPFNPAVLPLLSLHEIYRARTVPYAANLDTLRRLEAERPGVFGVDELRAVRIRTNAIIHESAHCIAKSRFDALAPSGALLTSIQRGILCTQLAEAYAQCVELFGSLACRTGPQRFFYSLASYIVPGPYLERFLRPLVDDLGLGDALAVGLVAYLCAGFLIARMAAKDMYDAAATLVDLDRLSRAGRTALRTLFGFTLGLKPSFRVRVTGAHYLREGFSQSAFDLLAFEFLPSLRGDPALRRAIADLLAVIAPRGRARRPISPEVAAWDRAASA
jgi:hypothetical protein